MFLKHTLPQNHLLFFVEQLFYWFMNRAGQQRQLGPFECMHVQVALAYLIYESILEENTHE